MVAMQRLADVWGPVMLTVVWQAALLAVLVLACERVLRVTQARARHSLWWIVLVAPLVLAPARLVLERSAARVTVPAPQPMVRAVEFAQSLAPTALQPRVGREAPALAPAARRAGTRTRSRIPLSAALMAVWLVGCTVVAARLLLGHRSLRSMIAASRPVDDAEASELLDALCAEAGVRRKVALRSTAELSAPLLYGLRWPAVLIPQEWLDSLSPADLRAVLAHEVAHIKRGDFLENLLQRLAELPLFFHPAAWLAGRRITLAREELCDAAALAKDADPRRYALSLLAAAERVRGELAVASVGVAEGKFTLLRRVEAIMRGHRVSRISRVAWLVLAAVVILAAVAFAAVEVRSTGGGGGGRSDSRYSWLVEPTRSEAVQVLSNMKNVALAVHMFMAEHDHVLPSTSDAVELIGVLAPYVKEQSVFLRPGTVEPAVQFTFEPGLPYSSVETPASTLMAVVDYHPEWRVEAYMDGHAILVPKADAAARAEKYEEALAHPGEVVMMAEVLFEAIQGADYDYFLNSTKQDVWKEFPPPLGAGYYCVDMDYPGWVAEVCTTLRRNPIVRVELGDVFEGEWGRPTIPYRLTLKDGAILSGELPFRYEEYDRRLQPTGGLDWHLGGVAEGGGSGVASGRAGGRGGGGGGGGGGGRGAAGRNVVAADVDFMPEALHVQSNMQRLGLAMRSYLLEHAGIFPKGETVDELLRRLGLYLAPESILVHATIGDPLDVRYLARSGAAVAPEKAAETPFAEATCATLPGLRVVAYADGHAESRPSGGSGSGGGGWALTAVLVNMEHLALAMRAYLGDHNNRFPAATDGRSLVAALETYLHPRLLFARPGTKDEVVVRYVMKPGTTWSTIPGWEAHNVWVFVADYSPEFTVVVDAQMLARIRGKD